MFSGVLEKQQAAYARSVPFSLLTDEKADAEVCFVWLVTKGSSHSAREMLKEKVNEDLEKD